MEKTAYSIARTRLHYCRAKDPIRIAADILQRNQIGSILAREGNSVTGILTVGDILRAVSGGKDATRTLVSEIMSSPIITAGVNTPLTDIAEIFSRRSISRIILTDERGEHVGVVKESLVRRCLALSGFEREAECRAGAQHDSIYHKSRDR